MEKKLLLFVNPFAGTGQSRRVVFSLINYLSDKYLVTVKPTLGRDGTIEYSRLHSCEYDAVVCCGGDGTLNQVVSGIMQSGTPSDARPTLGYVPCGTTNDFASSLGLPSAAKKASDIILSGNTMDYDIGTFNSTNFVYTAAFGAFTEASYATPQELKNSIGHLAYILEGIKSLQRIQPYHVLINHDGETLEDNFIFGAVMNSSSMGGLLRIRQDEVVLNDGLFELLLIKEPRAPSQAPQLIADLLAQKYNDSNIILLHSSHVDFTVDSDVPWTLDGEFGGNHRDITIINEKTAVKFFVPAEK